jgi:hypothetical protein
VSIVVLVVMVLVSSVIIVIVVVIVIVFVIIMVLVVMDIMGVVIVVIDARTLSKALCHRCSHRQLPGILCTLCGQVPHLPILLIPK